MDFFQFNKKIKVSICLDRHQIIYVPWLFFLWGKSYFYSYFYQYSSRKYLSVFIQSVMQFIVLRNKFSVLISSDTMNQTLKLCLVHYYYLNRRRRNKPTSYQFVVCLSLFLPHKWKLFFNKSKFVSNSLYDVTNYCGISIFAFFFWELK